MAQSNHEELVFVQRHPEDEKWFELLLREELVDDPDTFRSYFETIDLLITRKISQMGVKIRIESLFQNYPILLFGMKYFTAPGTNFIIPYYLLNGWEDYLTRATGTLTPWALELWELNPTPQFVGCFRDFLKLQSELHAIARGTYGLVLGLRYQLHKESGASLMPIPFIQCRVQAFLTVIKSLCERFNATPRYEQLLQIFRVYGERNLPGNSPENRMTETEVCQHVFSLFREQPFCCILMDFNLVLPFLHIVPYLSLF